MGMYDDIEEEIGRRSSIPKRWILEVICKEGVTDEEAENLLDTIEREHVELIERVERYEK